MRIKAIVKVVPAFKAEGRSDDYVSASFDAHVAEAKQVDQGLAVTAAVVGGAVTGAAAVRKDETDTILEAIEAKRLGAHAAPVAGGK